MEVVLCHHSKTYRYGKNMKYTVVIERDELSKTIRVHAMMGNGIFHEYVLNENSEDVTDEDILGTLGVPSEAFKRITWDKTVTRALPSAGRKSV